MTVSIKIRHLYPNLTSRWKYAPSLVAKVGHMIFCFFVNQRHSLSTSAHWTNIRSRISIPCPKLYKNGQNYSHHSAFAMPTQGYTGSLFSRSRHRSLGQSRYRVESWHQLEYPTQKQLYCSHVGSNDKINPGRTSISHRYVGGRLFLYIQNRLVNWFQTFWSLYEPFFILYFKFQPWKWNTFIKFSCLCPRIISENCIGFDQRRISGLCEMKTPANGAKLQYFVRAMHWMRRSISKFS